MNVLGDVIEAIMRNLQAANKKPDAPALAVDAPVLLRPWTAILAKNKGTWAEKHESGTG
jgi:hypothetical protein